VNQTSIAWVRGPDGAPGFTWNPVVGCTAVSLGCANCWAARLASTRLDHLPEYRGLAKDGKWIGGARFLPDRLDQPLHKRKPAGIFVSDMGDLFHESITDEQIAAVFGVMAACPWHRFFVLTKRAKRMREWFGWVVREHREREDRLRSLCGSVSGEALYCWGRASFPLPNVFVGVSIEDQPTADERIPELLQTPAAIRFISYEPALGPVDIGMQSATCDCCPRWESRWVRLPRPVRSDAFCDPCMEADAGIYRAHGNPHGALSVRSSQGGLLGIKPAEFECLPRLDLVIVGGESGPSARPCHVEWIRSIVKQCHEAGVKCFVKQLGARPCFSDGYDLPDETARILDANGYSGPEIDEAAREGRIPQHDRAWANPVKWPEDLRVREFPEVAP